MEKLKIHERFRLFIQCISFCFHNGYVRGWLHGNINSGNNKGICMPGLNCYSCPGAVGACPLGSLQAVLDSGKYHFSLYVFGFIAGLGVLCGRFVCGWLCPFGLIQDLLHRIPLFKKVKNMPGHNKLRWLRYVLLAVFVIILPATVLNEAGSGEPWFCEWICPSGTLLGGIPLLILNPALRSAAGIRFAWKCLILLAVIILSMKYYRPFCKYVCPLGAMYGVANPISIYRFKCDEDSCVKCGACQKACGMDIKVWETPNSIDCIRCGKCLKACPIGALSTTFTRKKTDENTVNETTTEAYVKEITENIDAIENTTSKCRKKPSPLYMIWGIILFAIGLSGALVALLYPLFYAYQAQVEGDLHIILYVYVHLLIWIVPAMMLVVFGNHLTNVSGQPGLLDKLRGWPKKLLYVWLGSFAVAYVVNIFTFFLEDNMDVGGLWQNFDLIFSNAKIEILLTLIPILLSMIFVGNAKKEGASFIENHRLLKHPLASLTLWAVVTLLFTMVVCSIVAAIITALFGFDASIVEYVVLIIAGIIFLLFFSKHYRPNFKGDALFKNCKQRDIIVLYLIFIGVDLVLNIIDIVQLGGIQSPSFVIFLGAIQPGFLEEVISRMLPLAAAMYIYKDRDSVAAPLVLSSVIFGLIHLVNLLSGADFGSTILQILTAVAAGLFFGALYLRTGTIIPGVFLHFLHDFMGNLEYGIGVATDEITTWGIIETIIFVVVQVALTYFLLKDKNDKIKSVWNEIWRE